MRLFTAILLVSPTLIMAARTSTITKSQLDIKNLREILDILQRHGYSGTSYYRFGLNLGLLPGALDVIKENNKGDVNAGLRECLKAWLQQADDVKSVGLPSYYSLIQALRKLGENAVADGIDREKHPACVIFTAQCESNESVVAALRSLAILLHNEKIIGTMLVPTREELLKAVKDAVCADYDNLGKFAEILKESQNTSLVGHSLLHEYKRSFPADCALITVGEQIKMTVPLDLCPEFTGMREKFSVLRIDVAKAMKKKVKIKKLKEYFSENKKHLRSRIASCKKIKDLISLIADECSLTNYVLLERAVNRFEVEEAKPAIEKYKKEIDEFYKEGQPLQDFLDKRLGFTSPLLKYKTVTFSVHKSIDDYELADINILMTHAFQRMAPEVALEFVREGNSFTITCSFPVLLSESLIATALDNIDSLIERGVKKLTIGYSTVYDHEKSFQGDKTTASKKDIMSSEMKQQLYASVYSSQGTMEQLLISRTIQLLNSEEELASVQQLKDENEKLETKVKVLSGMELELDQLRTREVENVKELELLRKKIANFQNENKKLEAELNFLSGMNSEVSQFRTKESSSQKTLNSPSPISPKPSQSAPHDPTAAVLQDKEGKKDPSSFKPMEGSMSPEYITMKKITWSESSSTLSFKFKVPEEKKPIQAGEETGEVEWNNNRVTLTKPSAGQCQEVFSQLTDSHQTIFLIHSSPDIVHLLLSLVLDVRTIKRTYIGNTKITKDVILSLSNKIANNTSLEALGISGDSINDDGVIALTPSLINNETMTILRFHNNPDITSTSAQSLAELLLYNHTLSVLWLQHTNIDTDGVLVLMESLRTNNTLKKLYLDNKHKQTCFSLPYYETIKKKLALV